MNATNNQLENALKVWENFCFLKGRNAIATGEIVSLEEIEGGSWSNFQDFRRFLLSRNPVFDEARFFPDKKTVSNSHSTGGWVLLPREIHQWSCQSRRIFRLSAEVQQFLETTSIMNIQWGDITFPFDSFGISLPVPLGTSYCGNTQEERSSVTPCDFILVTRKPQADGGFSLATRLLGIDPNYSFLSDGVKKHIDSLLQKGKLSKASKITGDRLAKLSKSPHQSVLLTESLTPAMMSSGVIATAEGAISITTGSVGSEVQRISVHVARIVMGLCLYLETTARRSAKSESVPLAEKWERISSVDQRTLNAESQVCAVTGEGLLSSNDIQFFKLIREKGIAQALVEMGTHFRSAHWRRPPGKGSDPDAIKTVFVRSAIVRPDRLPPDGLPPGTSMAVI